MHRFISPHTVKVHLAKVQLARNLQLNVCGNMISCPCCVTTSRTISSSAFTWREPSSKRFKVSHPHFRPKVPTVCCAASFRSAGSLGDAPVASIDVEFAHFLKAGKVITAAAEVCLLKDTGAVLFNSYICPDMSGVEGSKWIGGVTPASYGMASPLDDIQAKLLTLLHGHLLIGYGLRKDLMALGIMHPSKLQKDLMMCGNFQNSNGQARRLQDVAYRYLGQNIQAGKHSAREDAYAALQLYQLYVKDDPALMTYQELVEYELRKMKRTADSKPEAT